MPDTVVRDEDIARAVGRLAEQALHWCALLDRWDGQDWDTLHDATGASPAAAVNALAAKLEDDR